MFTSLNLLFLSSVAFVSNNSFSRCSIFFFLYKMTVIADDNSVHARGDFS